MTAEYNDLPENRLSRRIIGAAIEVHRALGGPGLLESVYEEALVYELQTMGHEVKRQKTVTIRYKGVALGTPLTLDVLVDNLVIVECKPVETYHPVFEAQALTYLRLTGLHLALVINFGEKMVRNGVHRVIHQLRANP